MASIDQRKPNIYNDKKAAASGSNPHTDKRVPKGQRGFNYSKGKAKDRLTAKR